MFKTTRILLVLMTACIVSACAGLDVDPTASWTAKDFYEEATAALDAGEFKSAIKNLETLEARFPFDPYAKQAQLDIAYSYYKFDEPESAISAADRFLRLHPRDPHIDYVYYLKGLINFNRGRGILDGWFPRDLSQHEVLTLHKSLQGFSTLIKKFPDSQYAGDAYQHMVFLRNMLAKQEIDTAIFYVEREAWLAAANRAQKVLKRYQESSWSLKALEIMVDAYRHLGLHELAADTQRILDLNQGKSAQKHMTLETNETLHSPPKIES